MRHGTCMSWLIMLLVLVLVLIFARDLADTGVSWDTMRWYGVVLSVICFGTKIYCCVPYHAPCSFLIPSPSHPDAVEPKSGTTWLARVIVELCLQLCGNPENTW